jgi:hypothetical protein
MIDSTITAYEFSLITGRPLPDVLKDLREGKIPYIWTDEGRMIPLSFLYPDLVRK